MKKKLIAAALLVCVLLAAFTPLGALAAVEGNDKAKVDTTNLADGYVKVAYVGGSTAKIKVIITGASKTQYKYDLKNDGTFEVFPFSEGDGSYSIGVYTNTEGSKYATTYTTTVSVKLKDQFAPFLVTNQYVNYTDGSATVKQAATLVKDITNDLDKVSALYNYVVKNFKYDKQKAATVQSGYLPNIDSILKDKKGICFDYAAVMTAMLRSQKIPCKLVVGYAGDVYHAWINIYTKETGWVNSMIQFDGKNWKLMDPTFASSGNESSSVYEYIGKGDNYAPKLFY
jgi:transglutaminase-like putative cysteine protease